MEAEGDPVRALDVELGLLLSGVAYLSGGRDRNDCAIITCPASSEIEESECTQQGIARLLKYLIFVARQDPSVQRNGVSLIVDTNEADVVVLKELLQAIQAVHVWKDDYIHLVYFVKPKKAVPFLDSIIHQHLQMFKFDYSLVEFSKLDRIAAKEERTVDLGGTLLFDQNSWVHLRMRTEPFIADCSSCAKQLHEKMTMLSSAGRRSFRGNQSELNSILMSLRVNTLIQEAESLQKQLYTRPQGTTELAMSASPDYKVVVERVERQLGQLRVTRETLSRLFQLEDTLGVESARQLEQEAKESSSEMEQVIKSVENWIGERGMEYLQQHADIGESQADAQEQLTAFHKFREESQTYIVKGVQICQEILLSSTNVEYSESVVADAKNLHDLITSFQQRMELRVHLLELSLEFHVLVQQIFAWSVVCLNQLSMQTIDDDLDSDDIRQLLTALDVFVSSSPAPDLTPLQHACDKLEKSFFVLQFKKVANLLQHCKEQLVSRRSLLKSLLAQQGHSDAPDGCQLPQASEVSFDKVELLDSDDDSLSSYTDDGNGASQPSTPGSEAQCQVSKPSRGSTGKKVSEMEDIDIPWLTSSATMLRLLRMSYTEATTKYPDIMLSSPKADHPDGIGDDNKWLVVDRLSSPDGLQLAVNDSDGQSAAYEKMIWMRQQLMDELIDTERKYIEDLDLCVRQYMGHIDSDSKKPGCLLGKRNLIFGNLERILEFNRSKFYPDLEKIQKAPLQLGSCFLKFEREFNLYSLYLKNKPAQEELLEDCKQYFRTVQIRLNDPFPLMSYLLKPFQRMCRYSQFLTGIQKNTPSSAGAGMKADDDEISRALWIVKFHLRHGNDLLALERLRQFDGNPIEQGLLLRQGDLIVVEKHGSRKRRVFLFEEIIAFCKTKPAKNNKATDELYIFRNEIKMSDVQLHETVANHPCRFQVVSRANNHKISIILQAESEKEKCEWVAAIQRVLWHQLLRLKERMSNVSSGMEISVFEQAAWNRGSTHNSELSFQSPRSSAVRYSNFSSGSDLTRHSKLSGGSNTLLQHHTFGNQASRLKISSPLGLSLISGEAETPAHVHQQEDAPTIASEETAATPQVDTPTTSMGAAARPVSGISVSTLSSGLIGDDITSSSSFFAGHQTQPKSDENEDGLLKSNLKDSTSDQTRKPIAKETSL